MTLPTLSGIRIYPVKSTAGQTVDRARVEERGLAGDRRWMIVSPQGRFLSGRELPRLVLINASVADAGLVLRAPASAPIAVALPGSTCVERSVVIWKDQVSARDAGDPVADWLSSILETRCRLVYMADEHRRPVDPRYSQPGDLVSFADGFPVLLISEASLEDLNSRLEKRVGMAHFRPNLVIKACAPYAEDEWRRIRIGKIDFDLVKACSRCVLTTVNPADGEQDSDGQPLTTLARYRRDQRGRVLFGVNLIPRGAGQLGVGDPLTVLE